MSRKNRSVEEIRLSFQDTRKQVEADLATVSERVQKGMDLRRILGRHPLVFTAAGALAGVVLARKPTLVLRMLGRVVGWGAPLLFSTLVPSSSPSKTVPPSLESSPRPPSEDGGVLPGS